MSSRNGGSPARSRSSRRCSASRRAGRHRSDSGAGECRPGTDGRSLSTSSDFLNSSSSPGSYSDRVQQGIGDPEVFPVPFEANGPKFSSDRRSSTSPSLNRKATFTRVLAALDSADALRPIPPAPSTYTYARDPASDTFRVGTSLSSLVALAPPPVPPPFITPNMPTQSNRALPPPSGPTPDAAGSPPRSGSPTPRARGEQHRYHYDSGHVSSSHVSNESHSFQRIRSNPVLPEKTQGDAPTYPNQGEKAGGGRMRAAILILIGVCIGLAIWPMFVSFLTFRLLHSLHDGADGVDIDSTDYEGVDDDGIRPDGSYGNHMMHNTTDSSSGSNVTNSETALVPPQPTFPPLTFNDLAGLTEAKTELQEVVQFLRDPSKFERLGARLPKGVLLVGPPGTGKTALARAVATEAGVPYFYASGSEFVEIYVGQGARRVRGLFSYARNHSPCIIFLDELDAVGGRRQASAGPGAGNREHDQTLNQLLVEMDGFNQASRIVVLAATNRVDTLDPALLRPGRFDRIVHVSLPDVAARELILQKYLQRVPVELPTESHEGTVSGFSTLVNAGDERANAAQGKSPAPLASPHSRSSSDKREEKDRSSGRFPRSEEGKKEEVGPETYRQRPGPQSGREKAAFSDNTAIGDKEGSEDSEAEHEKKPGLTQVHKDLAKQIAKITPGFSGAELENLVNEAALLAARADKEIVTLQELQEARDKVTMGPARKTRVMSAYQRQLTAYHEAGHAIIAFYLQPYADPIHKATIVSRGSALGFVEQVPLEDRYGHGVAQLEARLCVCMGGRVAERLIFGRDALSNGASSDIETATRMAYVMVTEWGMSEKLGPLSYKVHGRSRRAFISSETANLVEEEVKQLVITAERKAEKLLRRHRKQLREVALQLLEKETLSGEEISEILDPSGSYRTKVERLRTRMQQGEQPSFLQRLVVQLKRGFQWLFLPRDQTEFAAVEADKQLKTQEETEKKNGSTNEAPKKTGDGDDDESGNSRREMQEAAATREAEPHRNDQDRRDRHGDEDHPFADVNEISAKQPQISGATRTGHEDGHSESTTHLRCSRGNVAEGQHCSDLSVEAQVPEPFFPVRKHSHQVGEETGREHFSRYAEVKSLPSNPMVPRGKLDSEAASDGEAKIRLRDGEAGLPHGDLVQDWTHRTPRSVQRHEAFTLEDDFRKKGNSSEREDVFSRGIGRRGAEVQSASLVSQQQCCESGTKNCANSQAREHSRRTKRVQQQWQLTPWGLGLSTITRDE
ncbi:membrane protein FtsH1 [Toxoplasma gondii TgCatPRC2]|uniref:Membrane protein FtsH1 n=1 Tax=Toxoplasma gondii TgCatPRC2 TaxID=1130821 RepID=A0A151HLX9_TOXGO|nr:membrane protein FtsH1 [Toxoplasma gondii TgCatPRC2]